MDEEELQALLNLVFQKINDRPLILGAPQGITLTPNHVLLDFRKTHREEVDPDIPIQQQITIWNTSLRVFGSLWIQEFTHCCLIVAWKQQGQPSQVGDIVLFRNEPSNMNSPPTESQVYVKDDW